MRGVWMVYSYVEVTLLSRTKWAVSIEYPKPSSDRESYRIDDDILLRSEHGVISEYDGYI